MKQGKKVVVIGSEVTGLATAALLGKQGYEVTVLEKNPFLEGVPVFTKKMALFLIKILLGNWCFTIFCY